MEGGVILFAFSRRSRAYILVSKVTDAANDYIEGLFTVLYLSIVWKLLPSA